MSARKNTTAAGKAAAAKGTAADDYTKCTTETAAGQEPADHRLAVYHLARLLAGASDADLAAIRHAFPTIPLPTNDNAPDLEAVRAWLEAHPDVAKAFLAADPDGPPPTSRFSTWADMHKCIGPVTWAWPGWLANGILSIVASEPGQGKSALCLRLAACFVRGDPFPDGTPFTDTTGTVLWCEAEAAQAVNLERARAWQLPLDCLLTPFSDPLVDARLDDLKHREAIAAVAARADVRLIVVDSLRGSHRGDENSSELIGITKFLAELARDTGKPLLLTHHLRKRGALDLGDTIALDRLRGSSAIAQTARLVWALDVPNPARSECKRLSVIKSNLARFPEPIGLTIAESGITFSAAPEPPKAETLQDRAADLLLALLRQGPVPAEELRKEIEEAGLSWRTAQRAKEALGIVAHKETGKGGRWMWALPTRETPP